MGCNLRAEEEEEAAGRHKVVYVEYRENGNLIVDRTTVEGAIILKRRHEKLVRIREELRKTLLMKRELHLQGGGVLGGGSIRKRPRQDDLVESSEIVKHLPHSSIAAYGGSVFKHLGKYLTSFSSETNHRPSPTGTKAKAKGEPVRKRPRQDLGDSSEAFAESLNHSADSSVAAHGGSIFKRLCRYLVGEAHETHAWKPNPAADPSSTTGTKAEVGVQEAEVFEGGSALETECPSFKVLGESSEIFV